MKFKWGARAARSREGGIPEAPVADLVAPVDPEVDFGFRALLPRTPRRPSGRVRVLQISATDPPKRWGFRGLNPPTRSLDSNGGPGPPGIAKGGFRKPPLPILTINFLFFIYLTSMLIIMCDNQH